MSSNDGGPGFKDCRKCGHLFIVRPWQLRNSDYECLACKRLRQNGANAADPLFREKHRKRNRLPHVRDYNTRYQRTKVDPVVRRARRKVATEIEAGRLERQPCEVCDDARSDARHPDYVQPLDVRWLCRRHHMSEEHSRG